MATLEILQYPDRRLRKVAREVTEFDGKLARLAADMGETMYAAGGIGLAATQVNVQLRVVVMDLSETRDRLQVFVNPEISDCKGAVDSEEGCLSVPGVTDTVRRAAQVQIRARDLRGETFAIAADELLAICIQHEIDHLDGKVFVDYLSRMKQMRIRKRLQKELLENKTAPAAKPTAVAAPPRARPAARESALL